MSDADCEDGPIDVKEAHEIVKSVKDVIYELLDAYKTNDTAKVGLFDVS